VETDDGNDGGQVAEFRRWLSESRAQSAWSALRLLLVTIAAFVLTLGHTITPTRVAILVSVILVHELGHYVAMRAYGYRDVKIFFIPFLGAATAGTPSGVSPFGRGVVLLAGPVPGLAAGVVVAMLARPVPDSDLAHLVVVLVLLNGLNLLPFEPLDGGRLMHLVLSSRYRVLDVLWLAIGGGGLAWLAVKLASFPLGVLAAMMFMFIPRRVRAMRAAAAVRASGIPLPAAIEAAPDEILDQIGRRSIAEFATKFFLSEAQRKITITSWARDVYERARLEHPSARASMGLMLAQVGGLALGVAALVPLYSPRPGVLRPLAKTASSASGRVRAHFPESFYVRNQENADQLLLVRMIDFSPETLWLASLDNPRKLSDEQILDVFWTKAQAGGARLLSRGERCYGGRGVSVEYGMVLADHDDRIFECVVAWGDRAAAYKVLARASLFKEERPVLIGIAEATEFEPNQGMGTAATERRPASGAFSSFTATPSGVAGSSGVPCIPADPEDCLRSRDGVVVSCPKCKF